MQFIGFLGGRKRVVAQGWFVEIQFSSDRRLARDVRRVRSFSSSCKETSHSADR